MKLNEFELSIISAIGKHQPAILDILYELRVSSREHTGPGLYVDFEEISSKVNHPVQILDLFGHIELPNGLILCAHIEMCDGKPQFLEVATMPLTDWDGSYDGFIIYN